MSYTPTEWKTGDIITAEKLNNMETGVDNVFVAEYDLDNATVTAREGTTVEAVHEAFSDGKAIYGIVYDAGGQVKSFARLEQIVPQGFVLVFEQFDLTNNRMTYRMIFQSLPDDSITFLTKFINLSDV